MKQEYANEIRFVTATLQKKYLNLKNKDKKVKIYYLERKIRRSNIKKCNRKTGQKNTDERKKKLEKAKDKRMMGGEKCE